MASLNLAQIIGHIGREPESRFMPSGECVTNISVATTEKWKDKATGEQKEATEWHRVTFFGKLAEVAERYLKKGSHVYISGSIKTRKFKGADGVEKYATEIKGDTLQMLGGAPSSDAEKPEQAPTAARQQAQRPASSPSRAPNFSDLDDDIPF